MNDDPTTLMTADSTACAEPAPVTPTTPYAPELVTLVEKEIAALDSMTRGAMRDLYGVLYGHEPKIRDRRTLRRRLVWGLQARRFGGLTDQTKARIQEVIAALGLSLEGRKRTVSVALARPKRRRHLAPGTILVRQWHDREIRVTVREDGTLEFDGGIFRTLSGIAKHVTGQHWNGNLFFGLTRRERKP